ncbi:MAG: hypothetical protein GX605_14315, partial [Chloroflexi bacterium]|nr:hypothetical protein [Chloroflexota bacterium]
MTSRHHWLPHLARLLLGLTLLALALGAAPAPRGAEATAAPQGVVTLSLQGAAYERGVQQGQALRGLIRRRAERLLAQAGQCTPAVDPTALLQDSRDALPAQAWHELRGIAEGAGISLEAALLLNLWEPPSDAAAASESLAFAFAEHPSGRAALGVRGQTLCSDPLVFKAVSTAEGGSYGLLGRPGDLGGWIGMNKAGVALASLPAASADQRLGGLPSTTLLGLALQASTTA